MESEVLVSNERKDRVVENTHNEAYRENINHNSKQQKEWKSVGSLSWITYYHKCYAFW